MSTPSDMNADRPEDRPLSRREAREAAERAAGASSASPVPDGASPLSAAAAPHPADAQPAGRAESAPSAPTPAPTRAGRSEQPAAGDRALTDMADLFAAAPEEKIDKSERRRKRRRGCLGGLITLVVLVGILVAGGIVVNNVWGEQIRDKMGWGEPKDYDADQKPGEPVSVSIMQGDTGSTISATLYEAGVTKTSGAFYTYLIDQGANPDFYPGTYEIPTKLSAANALKALQDPANKRENTLLIKEGETAEKIYASLAPVLKVSVDEVKKAAADPKAYGVTAETLEGWLFPATYQFDEGTTPKQAIEKMVARTMQSLDAAQVPADQQERVLTIASIIQREARFQDDFYKVSRVIQNRIEQGMKLQMDSTAQYGYGEIHAGSVSTSAEAQYDDNPWNTYVIEGLPKTPISNPGDLAIAAAMKPADGPWLYFVTVNLDTGETLFTTDYADHERGVKQWQDWCAAHPDSGC